ncbi:MAG: beta-lactamase family protein [Deltaproteobacteria bacterium]|nr:beta-lactamase family protein [Deltaproteobacteria bacterium]
MPDLTPLEQLLDQGVARGVAPAVTLLLWKGERPLATLAAGQGRPDTIYDLASLTKCLATAPLALQLREAGRLGWDRPLGEMWGRAVPPDKADITPRQLLTHAAGLPAYRPYHELLLKYSPTMRRGLLKSMLMNEPLAHAPGALALYSDLGYLLLGLVLEETAGAYLEALLPGLYRSLGVEGPCFLPLDRELPWPRERVAPCGPLPGRPVVHGQVEDENAFALGGVAGHAGLFGTAGQVASVMDSLVRAARGGGPWDAATGRELFRRDPSLPGSPRTPGFDTPTGRDSAAGPNAPQGTVGHLGFTGVSLWWHPLSRQGVVLLTNRVALGRGNLQIRDFRRQVHELSWPLLGQ